jgi:hypothetical protein
VPEAPEWRLIGAADGTMLAYDPAPPNGAPLTLSKGQLVTFFSGKAFVVRSQDDAHPFYVTNAMTGSYYAGNMASDRRGNPTTTAVASTRDFHSSYTFFAPSLYPETDLVVVRARESGTFADVMLDCAGNLDGWTALGSYEYTHVALSRGNFEAQQYAGGTCDNGVHRIISAKPFGATLWGWGSALAPLDPNTQYMGYVFTLVGPTRTPTNPIEPP